MTDNKFSTWRTNLRIIWAITSKDILEGVKNRYAISVVITALFIAVMYSFIPTITSLDNPVNVLIYDAANSPLSAQLKESQVLEVYTYPSEEIMFNKLARGEVPELGIVIPAGFYQSLTSADGSSKASDLTGYVLYWVSDKESEKLTREVEAEITRLAGKPIEIQIAEERLIPEPGQNSLGNWVGAALVFLVIYTSLGMISNLMLGEKLARTLEVLMVSPASSWHLVMAKAITGLFYCLLGIAVTLAINQKIVLHWEIILPTLIIGAVFSISLGLIAGSMIEERGQLSLWTFGLLIPLFVPVFLSILYDLFPRWTNQVILWIPSVTFFQLLQTSFSTIPAGSTILKQFIWLTVWAIAGLSMAIWILRRKQQRIHEDQEPWIKKVSFAFRKRSHAQGSPSMSSTHDITTISTLQRIDALGQSKYTTKPASWMRIVQIIATKDIRQSIHNKMILSILLGTMLLVLGNALILRGLRAINGIQTTQVASSSPILAIMICITLLALGVALVPLLMVEEKEAHTLETLLVSPARYMQVMVGKALAGSAYCLSGVVVILIAYRFLIVHWELALLALLLGTAFVVALGLLIGMASNNPTTIGMWAAVIVIVLIIPAALAGLFDLSRVPLAEAAMLYWPSTAVTKLFNLAMMLEPPQEAVVWNAAVITCATILLYSATWWMVKRSDQ